MRKIFLFSLMIASLSSCASVVNKAVVVQLLGVNDFHGALEAPTGSTGKIHGTDAGGVEFLATHIKARRRGYPHSLTVSAGDLFGASPLLSALFKEQPTVEAMNLLGLELNAVGNHEFDKGYYELLRLQRGDCDNRDDCIRSGKFAGANFKFLAANVVVASTQKTLFPAYEIRNFAGVKIAFVGVVVQAVDKLVMAQSIEGLQFLDEADAVNALIPTLTAQGVHTVVVMIHEGGLTTGGRNECRGISGPIVDIARRMSDHVGVILSGHTHQAYNCAIGNKLVTSAASNGRLITEIFLELNPRDGRLISARADNLIVTRDVAKDEDQTRLIQHYKTMAAPIANNVIGSITRNISRQENAVGESAMGQIIADAQLAATAHSDVDGALVAFTNPGSIRTDLSYVSSSANEGDGNVTFAEAFAVQPFGNMLITMSLSGQQIVDVLEQQFAGCGFHTTRILQISQSFRYTYRSTAAPCEKIIKESITINNQPLDLHKKYRVTVNSFLADGGDYFSVFKEGRDRTMSISDLDALKLYFTKRRQLSPIEEPRICRQ